MIAFVGAFEEISDWNFREQLEVNFFGTANIIRCVLPGMRQRRSGHIINITGLTGQIGTPSLSLLSAAHHAVEGYSEVNHSPPFPPVLVFLGWKSRGYGILGWVSGLYFWTFAFNFWGIAFSGVSFCWMFCICLSFYGFFGFYAT